MAGPTVPGGPKPPASAPLTVSAYPILPAPNQDKESWLPLALVANTPFTLGIRLSA